MRMHMHAMQGARSGGSGLDAGRACKETLASCPCPHLFRLDLIAIDPAAFFGKLFFVLLIDFGAALDRRKMASVSSSLSLLGYGSAAVSAPGFTCRCGLHLPFPGSGDRVSVLTVWALGTGHASC